MKKYRIPNRKKGLVTESFLIDLKLELDRMFHSEGLNTPPNYYNFYSYFPSTVGFQETLKIVSKKHNIQRAIYDYACNLPWDKSDNFENELLEMMLERKIIEKGDPEKTFHEEFEAIENQGAITTHTVIRRHKGYNAIETAWDLNDLNS